MNKAIPVILGLGAIGGIAWWLFFREGEKSAPSPGPQASVQAPEACAAFNACVDAGARRRPEQRGWVGSAAATLLCNQHLTPACRSFQLSRVGQSLAEQLQKKMEGEA